MPPGTSWSTSSWVVLCPFTTKLTPLYTMSPSVCPWILFFSLFSEAVKHNAHFLSYVALVTSVCCLKAVMDAAWVQCWSVHLQPGHLICPITVSKEDFATLRRSALLEKRALSKRITFSDWIIQWGLGPGRGAIKQQITIFWERWKLDFKKYCFSIIFTI